MIVSKFGGTSLAGPGNWKLVKQIVKSNHERQCIVVSAPGKRSLNDTKVTDLLIKLFENRYGEIASVKRELCDRFYKIRDALNIDLDLGTEIFEINKNLMRHSTTLDEIVSRGEYLCAKIMAQYLGYTFVDSADLIEITHKGFYDDYPDDIAKIRQKLSVFKGGVVIPGYYGRSPRGRIKTFSRGGSDITGAILAQALEASLYENWTDVSGITVADPKIVHKPRHVEVITYDELRELAYSGMGAFHPDAVMPVENAMIPTAICNTFDPKGNQTLIVPENDAKALNRSTGLPIGIAGKAGFAVVTVTKRGMNREIGFAAKILEAFANHGVSVEHIPGGIDTLSVVFSPEEEPRVRAVFTSIFDDLEWDSVTMDLTGLALITVVGGLKNLPGSAAKIFQALAESAINVRMINQSPLEKNIIIGVHPSNLESGIKAIYQAFMGK